MQFLTMAPPTVCPVGSVAVYGFEAVSSGRIGQKLLPLVAQALHDRSENTCAFLPKWSLDAESCRPPSLHALSAGGGSDGGSPWRAKDHWTGLLERFHAVETRLEHSMPLPPPPGLWGASEKDHATDERGPVPELPRENIASQDVNKLEELIRLYLDCKETPDEQVMDSEAPTRSRKICSPPPGLNMPPSPSESWMSGPPTPSTQASTPTTLNLALLMSSEGSSPQGSSPQGSCSGDDPGLKEMPALPDAGAKFVVQWSYGSVGHPYTCAEPCKYVKKKRGCKDGVSCSRCHLCTWFHKRSAKQGVPLAPAGDAAAAAAVPNVQTPPPTQGAMMFASESIML